MLFISQKMKSILKSNSLVRNKKGQLTIGDAPMIVIVMLSMFMIMATAAFVLEKYQEGFGTGDSVSIVNETITKTEREAKDLLNGGHSCNAENFVITTVYNGSVTEGYETLTSENYTVSETGSFYNLSGTYLSIDWLVSYSYDYTGVACNVTQALTEEFADNTSIAGMVLTISLIGIVLSVLIGIFYIFTGKRGL